MTGEKGVKIITESVRIEAIRQILIQLYALVDQGLSPSQIGRK